MTARTSILLWCAGAVLLALSTFLAHWHLPFISIVRLSGIALEALGMVITVAKLLRYPGARTFLEH